jgi:hypothetical protein
MAPGPRSHRGRASFANGQNFWEVGLHQCPSERKGEGVPVRSLRVPSHVPSHPQTAAKVRGFALTASTFTAETDWLLEGDGFELPVPGRETVKPSWGTGRLSRNREPICWGTEGSNPSPSTGEAGANLNSENSGIAAVARRQRQLQ